MRSIDLKNLVKNFKIFCEMLEGKWDQSIFPRCSKRNFVMEISYLEGKDKLEKLELVIVSEERDVTIFALKDIHKLSVERKSEEDETGVTRYYSLMIITDRGTIRIRKDLRENKIIVDYESPTIEYTSTVIL